MSRPHKIFVWCEQCGEDVMFKTKSRREAIAMLDDREVHTHKLRAVIPA